MKRLKWCQNIDSYNQVNNILTNKKGEILIYLTFLFYYI